MRFNEHTDTVGQYRLCRKPAQGEILLIEKLGPLELALFKDIHATEPHWRILIPENEVPVDYIEVTRAEGPIRECDRTVTCRRHVIQGTGVAGSALADDVSISAFIAAHTQFLQWARTAPMPGGGYDKCDFQIIWTNGSTYQGRFDLQWGGRDGDYYFHESVVHRLIVRSGLASTPQPFFRKNAVEQWSDEEARRRYLNHVKGDIAQCREMLGMLEL